MKKKIAHISDLHIVSNIENLKAVLFDFAILAGLCTISGPLIRDVLKTPQQKKIAFKLISDIINGKEPEKINSLKTPSLLLIYELAFHLIRLKRIFYFRKDAELARDLLLEDIKKEKIDCVIITGDITNIADNAEFKMARDYLEKISSISDVIIIPGNHDVNIQRLEFSVQKEKKLDRYLNNLGKFYQGKDKYIFPIYKRFGELCIIGVDSSTFNPLTNAGGLVDSEQMDRLNDLLNSPVLKNSFKILALHHHIKKSATDFHLGLPLLDKFLKTANTFFIKELSNAEELISVAKENKIDFIMHGHKHQPYEDSLDHIQLRCAGSTTSADRENSGKIFYKIYEWSNGKLTERTKEISIETKIKRFKRRDENN